MNSAWLFVATSLLANSAPQAADTAGAPRMRMIEAPAAPPDAVTGEAADLPITFASGLPTLDVRINGQGPFRLALDTGAPGGPHLAPGVVSALGLTPAGHAMIGDPSGRNPTSVAQSRLQSIAFGSVVAKGWVATVQPMRQGKGDALDGIVGLDAFAGYVVTIDYPHARFTLKRGALPRADGKSVFSYEGQIAPTVPLTIENRTIDAHVDTGNIVAGVIVPRNFAAGLRRRGDAAASGSAHTLSNVVQMFTVPIVGMARVGAIPLAVLNVGYPAIIPVANIGSLALTRTVVEVDPAHERIRLRAPE